MRSKKLMMTRKMKDSSIKLYKTRMKKICRRFQPNSRLISKIRLQYKKRIPKVKIVVNIQRNLNMKVKEIVEYK